VKFEVSKRARRHIEKAQAWWAENRRDALNLFLDELASAERALRANPLLGVVYEPRGGAHVRRVLLLRSKRQLYYRYRADRDELVVLAVWGATRERGPKL
jgi:plasmid stabilization system protein ParE